MSTDERNKYTGFITDIKRFAVHDGDGIRGTVFFKGCPLKCVWCHNPETIAFGGEIAFYKHKCNLCGACEEVCGCHKTDRGEHIVIRDKCSLCGQCAKVCPNGALEIIGRSVTVDEIINVVIKDKSFYNQSGGGVTLSGGECLMQAEFCENLLKTLKDNGINTAVDTCGFAPREAFDKVISYTDKFLYDIKSIDEDVHIKCTGKSNKLILENLEYINSKNIPTEIRIPYVPNHNANRIKSIGEFLTRIGCVTGVRVLPYHNYAGSKYTALNMKNTMPKNMPSDQEITDAKDVLSRMGLHCL